MAQKIKNHLPSVTLSNVKPGDVLLSCGRAKYSEAIRLLDGGDYSHAAICVALDARDGPKIVESTRAGVKINLLAPDIDGQKYVDVYRFKSDTGEALGSASWPPDPVVERADFFNEQAGSYAFDQLYLMGVLVFIRKAPLGALGRANIRFWLDRMTRFFREVSAEQKKQFICSELVYRCFHEAAATPPGKYGLTIRGTIAPDGALIKKFSLKDETGYSELDPDTLKLLKEAETSFRRVRSNFGALAGRRAVLGPDSRSRAFNPNVYADTVTPGDLQRSPNLEFLGRLRR